VRHPSAAANDPGWNRSLSGIVPSFVAPVSYHLDDDSTASRPPRGKSADESMPAHSKAGGTSRPRPRSSTVDPSSRRPPTFKEFRDYGSGRSRERERRWRHSGEPWCVVKQRHRLRARDARNSRVKPRAISENFFLRTPREAQPKRHAKSSLVGGAGFVGKLRFSPGQNRACADSAREPRDTVGPSSCRRDRSRPMKSMIFQRI
jgi:hypothetical protein